MQLTRNNYEEYFLLYADGELTWSEMQLVEKFVQLHPDLAEELELIKETILPIDEMVEMPGKAQLLKSVEWQEETLTPVQQDLLLYLDNELPAAKKELLQKQLQKDTALQNDLKSLQKTVLAAETIVMPGKDELYRHERDRRPIPMMLVRWMAAAAVFAGLGWFGLNAWNNLSNDELRLVATSTDEPQNTGGNLANNTTDATNAVDENNAISGNSLAGTEEVITGEPASRARHDAAIISTASYQQQVVVAKNSEPQLIKDIPQQIAAVLPEPAVDLPAASGNRMAKITTPVIDEAVGIASLANYTGEQNSRITNQPNAEKNPIYQHAAYTSSDEMEEEYVNIAGARINKQKLRGVFRNVTRTVSRGFEKSTVTQENVSSL